MLAPSARTRSVIKEIGWRYRTLSLPNVIAMAIMIEMWTKSRRAYRRTDLIAIANPESRGANKIRK
jgi:hypothetical protein